MPDAGELPPFVTADVPDERPPLPADLGVGSVVVVFTPNFGRGKTLARSGEVTSRARVWIEVRNTDPEYHWPSSWRLRLDDQTDGSREHYAVYFRTPEQAAWERVRSAAASYLQEQRIFPELNSPWRHRVVLLARAVWFLDYPGQATP